MKKKDRKADILHELSQLLVHYARMASIRGEQELYVFDDQNVKEIVENAKRKKDALQTAMLMVDMYYGK